jgi:glyoxylase-like metal-dependent hydrolase (beta-lactamase superfamily II)
MTEPREVAEVAEVVTDAVWHWRIHNSNIGGGISSSHAVATESGCVLIDPVRLAGDPLAELPAPEAVLLDARTHQRASWRYRSELGLEVWLPEDAPEADEEPDRLFADGEILAGRLRAIRTPGPEWPHYCFLLERSPRILFCSDLVLSRDGRELEFVPAQFHDDPAETRRSVERLLDLDFEILCLAHGAPIADDPKTAIRNLLQRSDE